MGRVITMCSSCSKSDVCKFQHQMKEKLKMIEEIMSNSEMSAEIKCPYCMRIIEPLVYGSNIRKAEACSSGRG